MTVGMVMDLQLLYEPYRPPTPNTAGPLDSPPNHSKYRSSYDVTPCSLVHSYLRVRGDIYLYLHGRRVKVPLDRGCISTILNGFVHRQEAIYEVTVNAPFLVLPHSDIASCCRSVFPLYLFFTATLITT